MKKPDILNQFAEKIRTNTHRDVVARDIVGLASRDEFDEWQKDPKFLDVFNAAMRYLDKGVPDKEAAWQELADLLRT